MLTRITQLASIPLLLGACVGGTECPSEADAAIDLDAFAVEDVRRLDGSTDTATPLCSGGEQTLLSIAPIVFAMAPDTTTACGTPGTETLRIRLFRPDEAVAVYDRERPCASFADIGSVVPGEYEVAIYAGPFATGLARTRPEACDRTDASDDAQCRVSRVRVLPCRRNAFAFALHCDPTTGSCPAITWPWTEATP